MGFTGFDRRRVMTLVGTVVLAGAVVAAGVYGPSAWKVLRHQNTEENQVVIQTPPVDAEGADQSVTESPGNTDVNTEGQSAPTATQAPGVSSPPQADTSGAKKYQEPDETAIDLAPSVAGFFDSSGENGLSDDALTKAFDSAWNIHQYVDGYLFGSTAGPQMNEEDIRKYILFHKTVLDKQIKNEASASEASALISYLDIMFNRGMDAFDSKDKARIEQFHQEIHDLDTHLFRNDTSSKIYGATPFATKR